MGRQGYIFKALLLCLLTTGISVDARNQAIKRAPVEDQWPNLLGKLKIPNKSISVFGQPILGYDPARAADVEGFSPPFIEFDYTYLVPAGSSIRSAADADRLGVRVAVVQAHASTLTLTRVRKQAELVSVDTPGSAFELLRTGRVDAWASARQVLVDYSAQLPGSRVLEDRYGVNRPAVVVAKGETARLAFISEFIDEIKASGFVQEAITRSGWRGVRVAPPQAPTPRSERPR
jgi:polar amino acid transport system substrate-binding protein